MAEIDPCSKTNSCNEGVKGCPTICVDTEGTHLSHPFPLDLVPSKPLPNDYHRILQQPHCADGDCGQRIQLITMQGHEIRMMDDPSEASNISLTTSDASQHLRLDEMNKISWFVSAGHSFIMADEGHDSAGVGNESAAHKYLDPNQMMGSTYQLIQSNKEQKIWLSDSAKCPRIHAHTTKGHEVLLLDKSEDSPKGKIQITTYDKQMQIVMDVDSGDILINNFNAGGEGGNTMNGAPGSIRMYAAGEIELHAELGVGIFSNKDLVMGAPDGGIIGTDNSSTLAKLPSGPGIAPIPGAIKPSVLTDLIKK